MIISKRVEDKPLFWPKPVISFVRINEDNDLYNILCRVYMVYLRLKTVGNTLLKKIGGNPNFQDRIKEIVLFIIVMKLKIND